MSELSEGELARLRRDTARKLERGFTVMQQLSENTRKELRWEAKCREWRENGIEPERKEDK